MKKILLIVFLTFIFSYADSIPDCVKIKTCDIQPYIIVNKKTNIYLVTDCNGNLWWIETDKNYNGLCEQILFTAQNTKDMEYILNKTIVERKIPAVKIN